MESSEDTTVPCIQSEKKYLQGKDYDDGEDEGYVNEELDKTENQIKNNLYLFQTLFESCCGTLEQNVKHLRELADGLERVHFGTTVGSLTGGVVSVIGGVTSVVGLVLAPFTLGASLAVTGAGLGIATAGGVTSGVSNITKMVNESKDRENFEKLIKNYEDLMQPITECLRELIKNIENLQKLKSIKKKLEGGSPQNVNNILEVGARMGKGLVGGVPEIVRLVQVVNLGKVAAKASTAVKVAGVFTGVFSGLFIALDAYFIYQDAKEIHNMRGTNTDSPKEKKSAAVEFIAVIRKTAGQLEDGLNELKELKNMLNEGGVQRAQ
ncbi:apolipoprotein L3-like [Brienomyrus brachyistius]|uniref:apolipoprotein L3-like n=1 Tax=Brienomyrus brachyistius TaxID=42636 RepID=UPI0020B3AF3B|nr:apolipoprotein L3-like [Brienomyrus brachyistius]XP_048826937.1 apolipoprotein L3-like [Brienomyrus brachyistius]